MANEKFTGDKDEADAFVKALGRGTPGKPLQQDPRQPAPPDLVPEDQAGVGDVFKGADGLTYEVVEEVVATGEDYQEGADDNTGTEEDE